MYTIYILPILAYGLEVLLPDEVDLKPVASFHKKSIIQLCSLPDNVANPAPFILTGMLPLQAIVHKKALKFLIALCRKDYSLERSIVERQATLREKTSWVTRIIKLLIIYELPPLHSLLENLPGKVEWANQVNRVVHTYWKYHLQKQAILYPSLRYLNVAEYTVGVPHPTLAAVGNNTTCTYKSMIKSRLLTGTYRLQTTKQAFNQQEVDTICCLCKEEPETRVHMLAVCPSLQPCRDRLNLTCPVEIPKDHEEYAQLLLDSSKRLQSHITTNCSIKEMEHWGRRVCYALHAERATQMAKLPTRKRYGL